MELIMTLVLTKDTGRSYKYDLQKVGNPSANLLHDSTCLYINKQAFNGGKVPPSLTMKVTEESATIIVP